MKSTLATALALAIGLSAGGAAFAQTNAPSVPNPANPAPANPVATSGAPTEAPAKGTMTKKMPVKKKHPSKKAM